MVRFQDARKLTKREKAVIVAKDVLKQLKNMNVERGDYVFSGSNWSETLPDTAGKASEYVEQMTEKCNVCALGACLLSYIRKFNNVPTGALLSAGQYDGDLVRWRFVASFSTVKRYLKDIFSDSDINLIERVFENNTADKFWSDPENPVDVFNTNLRDSKSCLKAIMKNIIANNGVFRLPKVEKAKRTKTKCRTKVK